MQNENAFILHGYIYLKYLMHCDLHMSSSGSLSVAAYIPICVTVMRLLGGWYIINSSGTSSIVGRTKGEGREGERGGWRETKNIKMRLEKA